MLSQNLVSLIQEALIALVGFELGMLGAQITLVRAQCPTNKQISQTDIGVAVGKAIYSRTQTDFLLSVLCRCVNFTTVYLFLYKLISSVVMVREISFLKKITFLVTSIDSSCSFFSLLKGGFLFHFTLKKNQYTLL